MERGHRGGPPLSARVLRRALALLLGASAPAAAQYRGPHAADYLFVADVRDARALWVNPAGLGVGLDATLVGEVLVDRLRSGELSLGQYGAGFSSHGLAFAFRHDRLDDTLSTNTFRVGAGRSMGTLTIGAGFTFHTNADFSTQRELDLGVRARLGRSLELAAVLRHLFEPLVIDSLLPATVAAGFAWAPLSAVRVLGEIHSADDVAGTGVVNAYRAGVRLSLGRHVPIGALGVFELDDAFEPARLVVGLSVGGDRRGILLAADRLGDGTVRAASIGLVGLAINRLEGRGR